MSDFTKGPWHVMCITNADTDCDCGYILDEGGTCIGQVFVDDGKLVSDGGNDSPPLEEAMANASLIAAAPDMYEALKACIDELNSIHSQYGDTDNAAHHSHALAIASASIAKAEGKQ